MSRSEFNNGGYLTAGGMALDVSSVRTRRTGCSDFAGIFKSCRLLNEVSLGKGLYAVGKCTVLADEYSLSIVRETTESVYQCFFLVDRRLSCKPFVFGAAALLAQ